MDVLLATAIPKAEGGLKATVDPVTAQGFQSCRLVQAGAPADVSVRPQSGMALWRFQSIIGADGEHRTEGRLQVGGIAAFAVRQGQLDLKAYLQSRLGTRLGTIRLKQGGKDRGTGPVTISFGLRFKSQSLAPQDWLGKPYPELDWLRPQTRFLGPLINDERIDWEFQWASQSAPLPPTRSKTLTEPELVGSATWTLGSVRSVRFVQELRWQLKPILLVRCSCARHWSNSVSTPSTGAMIPHDYFRRKNVSRASGVKHSLTMYRLRFPRREDRRV